MLLRKHAYGLSLVAMPAVLGMLSIFSVLHFPSLFPFPLFLLRAGFKTLVMDVSLFAHSVGQQDLASQILILSIAAAWKNVVHFFEDSEVVAIRMRPASRGREVHCFQYTAFRPRPDGSLLCVLAAGLTSVQVGWRHRHAQVRDHRVSFTPVSLKCLPCVPETSIIIVGSPRLFLGQLGGGHVTPSSAPSTATTSLSQCSGSS